MRKVRVVTVDDSEIVREVLRELLEEDGTIEVVGTASNGAEALEVVPRLSPDLVTMDIEMPEVNGLEATEALMKRHPVPILIVTSRPAGPHTELAYLSVASGALDISEKPANWDDRYRENMRDLVRTLSRTDVAHLLHQPDPSQEGRPLPRKRRCSVIGIGSSSGGPKALVSVLGGLPGDFPACIGLVQKLPAGFLDSFLVYLRRRVELDVYVVETPVGPQPGTVFVAPDGGRLAIDSQKRFFVVDDSEQDDRSDLDVMFESLASVFGAKAVGVVLTGATRDGQAGIRALHDAGALTIAQGEGAAVAEMPQAAIETGLVDHVLPLHQIAPMLLDAIES